MRYTIENLNDDIAKTLTAAAESNHRSFDEEVLDALNTHVQVNSTSCYKAGRLQNLNQSQNP